jgi:hypothetical protein
MEEAALREGRTPQAVALASQAPKREHKFTQLDAEAVRNRFRRHFGTVKSGYRHH